MTPRCCAWRACRRSAKAKKGFKARCHATAAGKCAVTVTRGKKVIFRGVEEATAGQTVMVSVKPTAAGKALLKRNKAFSANARLAAPGGTAKTLTLKFKR